MSRPRLVLMVPLRRCGSNALRLRLNLGTDLYSPYPLHLSDLSLKEEEKDLADDAHYFQMIVDIVGLQSHSLLRWPIAPDPLDIYEALRGEESSRRCQWQIYGELLRRAAEHQGASVVLDKCQDSVGDFERLVELFPDIIFLDLVRDPCAQVCSMNRSILYDFDSTLNALRWAESRRWVDRVRAIHPSRIQTFRYEDLITHPETTLRAICDFIGIAFDSNMLDISQSVEAKKMASLSPLWETNASNPNPSHIHKYKEHLSPEEIAIIETIASPWMDALGYSLSSTNRDLNIELDLENARRRSEQRAKEAWKNLAIKYPLDHILRRARLRYLASL